MHPFRPTIGKNASVSDEPSAIPAARVVIPESDRAEIASMIDTALSSGSLTLGPITEAFEAAFSERHRGATGSPHAVAVSSGTAALEITVRILAGRAADRHAGGTGLNGGEVVMPTNTFFATAAAVIHAGGVPRFADVDAATMALSADTLAAAITPRSVGVIVVHIGGLITPDIDAIAAMCKDRGMWMIEDAAHAHGSRFAGRSAGSFGAAAAFSFYPTKVITSAEGGMIVSSDAALADDARIYRDQGKAGFLGGEHIRMGYNWRLSELHAAVGCSQMRRLDEFINVRQRVARRYDKALDTISGIGPLPIPDACSTNYYKYVALLDPALPRDHLKAELKARHGVSLSGEVYAQPLHLQPVLEPYAVGPLPVAEDVCARHVCLPIFSDMTDAEADRVICALAESVR